ncbi:MAG TPA: hypothetical protein VML55_13055 [Planctomycetaceae bacterium]|nr:hypothetical protein [Planctomycetaceae bacterium]
MLRLKLVPAAATVLLAAATMTAAQAQTPAWGPTAPRQAVQHAVPGPAAQAAPQQPAAAPGQAPQPIQQAAWMGDGKRKAYWHPNQQYIHPGTYASAPGYVFLNAPLYPVPEPRVPYQTGMTLITNQALAPHEFLYPHEYKALYPPYYYRVKGSWVVTPWGVWSHDRWKLQGTEVEVEYHPHYSLFSLFVPPRVD